MATISADKMRMDAEFSIDDCFNTADQHAQRWNQTADRANTLMETRNELQNRLGKPLTLLNLISSWIITIAIFGSFVLMEALINRDTLSTIFGGISSSQWEEAIAVFAGACIAIINVAAGHTFARTIKNAEENPVTGKKSYNTQGLVIPLCWIVSYLLFQQFLIRSAGGSEFISIQGMSLFLGVLEFMSAFILLKPLASIMLGLTTRQIQRANRILTRERGIVSQNYAQYNSQRQRYNELYPDNQITARHSNYINVCLGLQPQPQVTDVGNDEIEDAVGSILGNDTDNSDESSTDYQL